MSYVASLQTRDAFAEQIIYSSTLLLSRCCNIVAQRANVVPIILTPESRTRISREMACRDTRNYFPTLDLDRRILTHYGKRSEIINTSYEYDYDLHGLITFCYYFLGILLVTFYNILNILKFIILKFIILKFIINNK